MGNQHASAQELQVDLGATVKGTSLEPDESGHVLPPLLKDEVN